MLQRVVKSQRVLISPYFQDGKSWYLSEKFLNKYPHLFSKGNYLKKIRPYHCAVFRKIWYLSEKFLDKFPHLFSKGNYLKKIRPYHCAVFKKKWRFFFAHMRKCPGTSNFLFWFQSYTKQVFVFHMYLVPKYIYNSKDTVKSI